MRTNAMSAVRKAPYGKVTWLTVKRCLLKSPDEPAATPTSGTMNAATNAVTTAPKAAPITRPTARSTTLPRRRNFRKPVMTLPRLDDTWSHRAVGGRRCSGNGEQHAGVEDAGRVDRCFGRRQRPRERVGALVGVPPRVVAADRMVVGDGAAGAEDRFARGLLHGAPLCQL